MDPSTYDITIPEGEGISKIATHGDMRGIEKSNVIKNISVHKKVPKCWDGSFTDFLPESSKSTKFLPVANTVPCKKTRFLPLYEVK